jgi:hypothetical protein
LQFVFGQRLGHDVDDAHLLGDVVGHPLAVPGEQHLAAKAQLAQCLQGLAGFGLEPVGQAQPGQESSVQRQPDDRPAVIGHRRGSDTGLAEQLRAPERGFALFGAGQHAKPLELAHVA